MPKINESGSRLQWIYNIGFFIILALPLLAWPPYFFPVDWGKSIIFRSTMAILLFLFFYQFLLEKNALKVTNIKKNPIFWALAAFFFTYLLASIFSVDPLFSFWGSPYRGGGFVTLAFCLIFALLAFILFKKEGWEKALDFSIFIGILVSLVGIIQYYGLFDTIFLASTVRPPSTMGNPDILALYLLLLFFIAACSAIKENATWKKGIYIFSVLIFSFAILISGSRAVYLGLAIGTVYFVLAYPKKITLIKLSAVVILVLMAGIIFYANVAQMPEFVKQNKILKSLSDRLSISLALNDPRFYAWAGIDYKILLNKPVLGYGPENFAVGFDTYYDPSVPYLGETWWDRAHNIIFQTGSDAGFFGIVAYLALFAVLIWKLQKIKKEHKKAGRYQESMAPHAIQATLIGYFSANLFGFDSFSTYLIFFLLIGYSMHLTAQDIAQENTGHKKAWFSGPIIFILFFVLVIFLWQYNILPLQINGGINKSSDLVGQKQCDQALALMDKMLDEHSFLDSYARTKYVEFEISCSNFYPQNNLAYAKKSIGLLNEAVKIQPFYTRYWLFLGELTTTLAEQETDRTAKDSLVAQANEYLDKALQLAPKHQDILSGKAKIEIDAKNYESAKSYSQTCISENQNFAGCYWYLGLAEIYLKEAPDANKNIQTAIAKGYNANSDTSLVELGNAYNFLEDYQDLKNVFEKLVALNPNSIQYHSSLAVVYRELGQYGLARQEATKVLQLSPASKQDVDAFLKTLP